MNLISLMWPTLENRNDDSKTVQLIWKEKEIKMQISWYLVCDSSILLVKILLLIYKLKKWFCCLFKSVYEDPSINKALAVGNTVYSCTFFKEINSDGSLYIPEGYQHKLLYWLLCPEVFLYWRVGLLLLKGLSFQLGFVADHLFSPFVNIFFLTSTYFSVYITSRFSVNFTWFAFLSHQKFDETTVQAWSTGFATILNLKKFLRGKTFCYKPISNNAEFVSIEKKKFLIWLHYFISICDLIVVHLIKIF